MKRFFIFVICGPLIAGTVFSFVPFVLTIVQGQPVPAARLMLFGVLAIAMFQVLPSLLAFGANLIPFPLGWRMLCCSLAGLAGAGVIVSNYRGYMGMFASGADIAAFVVASSISAAVCSWLSRITVKPGRAG
jgi:hypothetical protein